MTVLAASARIGFVCCACLLICVAVFAAAEGAVGEWTTHVNSYDVRSVAVEGSLVWGATTGGAVRYDPASRSFIKLVRERSGALVSNELSCVAVGDGGRLWLGTAGWGLNLLYRDGWTLFAEGFTDLPSNNIRCLSSNGGSLWVGTSNGLALFEGSTLSGAYDVSSTSGGIPNNVINDVRVVADTVWCATEGGVGRGVKSGGVYTWQVVNGGLGNLGVLCVGSFQGATWVGTRDGTYRYEGGTWVKKADVVPCRPLALERAGESFFAAAADSGVFVWQSGSWQRVSPYIAGVSYRDLAADAGGLLWCAASKGLLSYDGARWDQY
ncbi:MAG: hypothetical protein V2A71_01890, partial [Candidatus Eisenbacteria bacterium]